MTSEPLRDLLPPDASATLRLMAEAALLAGESLRDAAKTRDRLSLTEKTQGDFVSEADLQAEALIKAHLSRGDPTYGWIGEETGTRPGSANGLRWIVDPLDGTLNFLKGLPHWAISIALYRDDTPLTALVYDPAKAEMFSADAGSGAFLNGSAIAVSRDVALPQALVATGLPAGGRSDYLPHALRDLEGLMPRSAGLRRWGAAALDLAYVAAGRFDAYWERNLGAWDIAAGVLLVTEAGGHVTPLWPGESLLQTGSFIASNGALHGQIATQIDTARRASGSGPATSA